MGVSSWIKPLPARRTGLGEGRRTASRLRVTPSTKACCTAEFGEPSPIWQHGAVTKNVTGRLLLPSLTAVIVAAPPPTARNVTTGPDAGSTVNTRELVETQAMARPSSNPPLPE